MRDANDESYNCSPIGVDFEYVSKQKEKHKIEDQTQSPNDKELQKGNVKDVHFHGLNSQRFQFFRIFSLDFK